MLSPTASWICSGVFAAIGLWFIASSVLRDGMSRAVNAVHGVLSLAMIGMLWQWDATIPDWLRVVVFAPVVLWFLFAAEADDSLHSPGVAVLCRLHHASMAAVMSWPMSAMAPMTSSTSSQHMGGAHMQSTGAVIADMVGCYLVISGAVWVAAVRSARSSGPAAVDAASFAAMSVGMGALVLAMV